MKAVLFKLNQLGDNIAFVPSVQALRGSAPPLHITVVTTPGTAELFGGELGAHEMVVYPKGAFDKSYRRPWRLAHLAGGIRRRHPDACLMAFDQGTAAHLVAMIGGKGSDRGGPRARPVADRERADSRGRSAGDMELGDGPGARPGRRRRGTLA